MKPKFADTMIGARNYQGLVNFYQLVGGFDTVEENELYTLLRDQQTNQVLCVCNGSPMPVTGPGWQTEDFSGSLDLMMHAGATLVNSGANSDQSFQFAVMQDPEGNYFLLWAGAH